MSPSIPPSLNSNPEDDPESDYDDLDDVIPSFTAAPPAPAPPPAPNAYMPAAAVLSEEDDLTDEAFAAELAKGMESLLQELAGGPASSTATEASSSSAPLSAGTEGAEARVMKEAWEKVFASAILESEGAAPPPASSAPKPRAGSKSGGGPEDFQRSIRETMERLKQSQEESSKPSATPDDPLAALLASLGDLGGDSGDGEGVLESMMDGLMSKDVLYDPLKELDSKYPTYLTSSEALALPPPELHAYNIQADLVKQIVTLFDRSDFSDDDEVTKAEVRELMGKMQDLGSPPKEVMGDMPDGFELGPDGLPNLGAFGAADGEACVIC